MPCFYCNVSDAWLFREKSKRLWVTFAGGYFELFVWALAVFAWRLTALDSAVNYVAFLVIVSAGIQSFFNFNPLLKLDGYYLLSDWMEIPNLRQRALNRAKAHFRRFGWGGPKPQADRRGRFLTTFGFVCWSFSGVFLAAMLLGLAKWFGSYVGSVGGYLAAGGLAIPAMLGVFGGTSSGEFTKMITKRRMRTFCWLLMLCGLFAGLRLIEVDEYSSGSFTLRPARRMEFRAPVAGFLKEVRVNEGDHVSPGDVIARLEIPELDSRIGRQRAELAAAEAELELLREGTRPETIADQKQRIARAGVWRAAADADLLRQKAALGAELNALQAKVAAARVVRAAAGSALSRMKIAVAKQAATPEQLDEVREKLNVAEARVKQAQSEWLARKAQGLLLAKRERDRRAKELADEQAALTLLEAGSRPQEIVAGKARVARVKSELNHLRQLQGTLEIRADVAGVVVTPRLREKIGAHLREGDAICTIEDRSSFEAEIALTEQKIAGIQPGQRVELKARALPFETLTGRVTGVAQSAVPQERSQSAVVVYSRIESPHEATRTLRASGSLTSLRSELTGHARIYTARKPIGEILLDRTFRLLRTEFWW
jgi:multidrug efflux pump subunit AcrA (membrane-fusion protein)